MMFASREQAGQKLGEFLRSEGVQGDIVLGLPRGGVIVAAGVAQELGLPLNVLVVRKIGHPLYREFAIGAMAEGGVVLLDERIVARNPMLKPELERVIAEEEERLRSYRALFHNEPAPSLNGQRVLLVDDGLATGSTMEAAVLSARNQGAARILVAVPTASTSAVHRLSRVSDEVRAMVIDPEFDAVGNYYEVFTQTTDEEVMVVLNAQKRSPAWMKAAHAI